MYYISLDSKGVFKGGLRAWGQGWESQNIS